MKQLFLLLIIIIFTFPFISCEKPDDNDAIIIDYSGTYYVTMGAEPRWIMILSQSDTDATFTMEGPNISVDGAGSINNDTMILAADIEGTLTINAIFSYDEYSFQGTWEITGDNPIQGSIMGTQNEWNTYDIDGSTIPQFISNDYIELANINRISKFRSGAGHDYSDTFESCRSMKHYFIPKSEVDWSIIKIFSPVNGTVIGTTEEWDGTSWVGTLVGIKPDEYPAFNINIFHVNLNNPLIIGDRVTKGQELGTHLGNQLVSDIAVGVHTSGGYKLVSYFDTMTNLLFQNYQARGLNYRDNVIISKEERDADPLTCNGEEFVNSGNLENNITLNNSGDGNDDEIISMITPYINEADVTRLDPYSSSDNAPWGYTHRGIDFHTIDNLKPFQAVSSGTIDDIDLSITEGSSNWQVSVTIYYNATYSVLYGFEPMTAVQADGENQLANITVSVGQEVAQGDVIGYLYSTNTEAHVHFGLFKYVSNGGDPTTCPESYFTPEARNSILNLIHLDHPDWNMCY